MSKASRFFSPCSLALLALRTSRGWTQTMLAQRSQFSTRTVISWENGTRTLDEATLRLLGVVMGYEPIHVDAALFGLASIVEAGDAAPPATPPFDLPASVLREARLAALRRSLEGTQEREVGFQEEARARWHAKARTEADGLVRRLLALPREQREAALEQLSVPGAPRWPLIERACLQSQKEIASDPDGAEAWALLALHSPLDPSKAADDCLRGYVFAFLGDVFRVQGKLGRASGALGCCHEFWGDGVAAAALPLRTWWLDELHARLLRDEGKIGEALALHEDALELALPEERPKILEGKAETFLAADDLEGAIEALRLALYHLPEGRDSGLRLELELHLADLFTRRGRFHEAGALLPGARRRAEGRRSLEDLGRVLWIQARIDASRREPEAKERARAAYEQLRADFSGRRQAREAVQVSLELAALLIEIGDEARLRGLGEEMAWVATTPGLPSAAGAALRTLLEAPHAKKSLLVIQAALDKLRRPRAPTTARAAP